MTSYTACKDSNSQGTIDCSERGLSYKHKYLHIIVVNMKQMRIPLLMVYINTALAVRVAGIQTNVR